MTRLIDADALNIYDVSPAYGTCVMGVTEEDIDEAPTVEAEPVMHGKWIPYKAYLSKSKDSWVDEVRCSVCGYAFGEPEWKYCPECGSRMDAE